MTLANLPSLVVEWSPTTTPLATPVWVDITAYVREVNGVQTTRGRPVETAQFTPGNGSLVLDNRTRIFDPSHGPAWVVYTGTSGDKVTTPDVAGLDITGDIEFVARVKFTDYTGADSSIISKYASSGTGRAYRLQMLSTGKLSIRVTPDGTSASAVSTPMTAASPFVDGTAYWVKATLDVVSGGNRVAVYYYAADQETEPTSWTTIETVTTAGTTSIYAGTDNLSVGCNPNNTDPMTGSVYRAIVRNGIGGTKVADFAAYDATDGSTGAAGSTWTSSATGEVWTMGGVTTLVSGSPYYGMLTPGKKIRVRGTWSATPYDLITGHIQGYPQRYANGNVDAVVPIEILDGLGWLAQTTLPDPINDYAQTTGIADCDFFLRQNDGTNWVDVVGGTSGFVFSPAPNGSSLCAGSDSPSIVFESATAWVNPAGVGGTQTLAFWIQTESVGASSSLWASVFAVNSVDAPGARIGINDSGQLCAEAMDYSPGVYAACRTSVAINDGNPHFVTIVNTSGTGTIYVDGVNVTVWVATGSGGDTWPSQIIGAPAGVHLATDSEFVGSLQDVVGFNTDATAVQAAELYRLFLGDIRETTSARVQRVLGAIDWTANDLTSAPYGVCWAPWREGDSALSHLQMVAETEQGRLFVAKDGDLTLLPRYWHQTDTRGNTSQATFSSDGADVNYQSLGTDLSAREVQNDITVSSAGIGSANSQDTTSKAAYGLRSQSVSTLLPTIALCQSMADGLCYWRKNAVTRIAPLVVMPGAQTSKWATVLGLELGDRVTVEVTPNGVGSQVVLQLLVESLSWDIDGSNWVLTIGASPVPPSFAVYGTDLYGTGRYGF